MPTARNFLGVGVVNGILYAVGGMEAVGGMGGGRPTAVVEAYDPATDSWVTKASMPTARVGLAVGVVNGILYAVGGVGTLDLASVGTVEAYDPATNTRTTKTTMPTARWGLRVGVVNGILYAVGGLPDWSATAGLATVETYDPVTNSWATKTSMLTLHSVFGIGVVNGILYAAGGVRDGGMVRTVEAFDPATNG